jgi:protease I
MKVVFIIAPEGFKDEELIVPMKIVGDEGMEVDIASTIIGECTGAEGTIIKSNKLLGEINVLEYDGIIFVGGPGTILIRKEAFALSIAREANEQKKVLGAICWAPTILAKSHTMKGRKATVWKGMDIEYGRSTEQVLEMFGVIFVDEDVVVDYNIITANGPQSAEKFGKELVKLLKEFST